MKNFYLFICLLLFFSGSYFPVHSQDVNNRKFNPDQPVFFTPKNHDPNFLKSGKLSDKSFYQRKSEWKHIIDTTWGPGAPLTEKLLIYNTYAMAIHDKFDGFYTQKLNWDSLYNHYLSQITQSTSKGAFSSIMSHFAHALNDHHTAAWDSTVVYTPLNPGVPILLLGNFISYEHFGVVTTILSDSTTLVLRVPSNYPLNLEPGDIILGYEGVPWKNLVKELLDAGLPMMAIAAGCKSAEIYHNLMGAGLNWHLFSTMDILKHSTGDTLHLSVAPLLGLNIPRMSNNEQMPIQNIPFPKVLPYPEITDTVVTYGKLVNTNIGYIYLSGHLPTNTADVQFYNAINSLKSTDALIIDMRLSRGGWALFENAFNILFNEYHKILEDAYRCNTNTFDLCPATHWDWYKIDGLGSDYYDRPIAVLLGPSCASMGDLTAQRLRYHPMVKFFGASSNGTLGDNLYIKTFPDWFMWYSISDMFHISEPGVYLNRREFPIDYPVWFNKDDVAKGIDPIVEKSLSWINNLAYGHDVTIENGLFSPAGDTATISAIVENPNSHELSAKLIFESLDGSIVDSTDMVVPNLTEVSQWQGKWKTPGTVENTYWVSLKVKDLTDGSSFNNKHATRITTVPLVLDKLISTAVSGNKYTFQPQFKNEGKSLTIYKITATLTCNDPWVKSVNPDQRTCADMPPGQTKKTQSFEVAYDAATFPNYFNLKFSIASNGWPYWVKDTTISIISGIEQVESLPLTNFLDQNYPNPFNSATTITWQLAHSSRVTLKVFDKVGRTVATLVDGQRPSGKYEIQFNAATLPKSVYFYQIKAGEFNQTKKMVLMK
jgi:hypothetical protein